MPRRPTKAPVSPELSRIRAQVGLLGGRARMAKYTPEEIASLSRRNGNLILERYGQAYFSAMGRLSAQAKRRR